ncbi:tetratricopeptide repeat protein [Thermodesulfobacteriota bacterium]
MPKTKVSRKELLKKPDEFITFSARVIIYAREHSRQVGYLGAVVVGLILIYLGINTYMNYVNKKGQNMYNMAYYTIVKNLGVEKNQEDLKKSEELFNQVIDKYGISKAARLALPELAYVKFLQKEYDEAISKYQEFLNEVSDDPYQSLARMALAVCYEEKGEFEKALQTLEQIGSGPDDFFKEQAMLSLARVYRITHKEEKSNEILNEFIERFEASPFLPIAKAYLKP